MGLVALTATLPASVAERLYRAFDGVALWDFPLSEFATKLPLDKND